MADNATHRLPSNDKVTPNNAYEQVASYYNLKLLLNVAYNLVRFFSARVKQVMFDC